MCAAGSSGCAPAGFALDPTTVGFAPADYRRPGALEQALAADFLTLYFDLVRDSDPRRTIKNQFFFDGMDQYKLSEQPFSQEQRVYVIEDKLTLSRLLREQTAGTRVEMVASVNVRRISSDGRSSSGDYGTHRNDPLSGDGLPGPLDVRCSYADAAGGEVSAAKAVEQTTRYGIIPACVAINR